MRQAIRILALSVVASLAVTLLVARYWPTVKRPGDGASSRSKETTAAIDWDATHGNRVLVLGDRFARDWFRHWGSDGHAPIGREGMTLALGDLDKAPAETYLEQAPDGTVAFFMLGPGTLRGGSSGAARSSCAAALARVDAVAKAASAAGIGLIVGGPLPASSHDTDAALVSAQRRYRDGLLARRKAGRLLVLDCYGGMTSAGGATLVKGYGQPGEDALTDAGFSALDRAFFPFVEKRFR